MNIIETHKKPSIEEMTQRLARLQNAMIEAGLDFYILEDANNVLWLTNFANIVHERPFVMVVPAQGCPKFLMPRLELDHVESRVIGEIEYVTYQEFPAPSGKCWDDRLGELLKEQGAKIAIEPTCPVMVANVTGSRGVISEVIDDVRAIKSDYEIGRIAYACRLLNKAHDSLLENARIGWSQSEINGSLGRDIFVSMMADNPNLNPVATKILTLIQNSSASHDPHNFSDLDMAMTQGGPHVSVFNAVLNGYGAEIERTFFLEEVPENAKKPFEVMLEARHKVFEMTRPGVLMHDVDEAANNIFRKHGYEDAMRHRAGHGMGVTSHEGPFLAEGEYKVIRPGMVFTIEPGIYLEGIGGFRHSDTVVTTEDGLLSLTTGAEDLEGLTL